LEIISQQKKSKKVKLKKKRAANKLAIDNNNVEAKSKSISQKIFSTLFLNPTDFEFGMTL